MLVLCHHTGIAERSIAHGWMGSVAQWSFKIFRFWKMSDACSMPFRSHSDAFQMPVRCLSYAFHMPLRCLSDAFRCLSGSLDFPQTSCKIVSNLNILFLLLFWFCSCWVEWFVFTIVVLKIIWILLSNIASYQTINNFLLFTFRCIRIVHYQQ